MRRLIKKIPMIQKLASFGYVFYKMKKNQYKLLRAVSQSPLKIVVGASEVYEMEWVPTDIQFLNLTNPYHWKKYFNENSIDAILSEHVWEHLTLDEGLVAAKQCYKYLKYNGYIRVAVPDGLHPNSDYIDWVKVNGTGAGAEDHKVLYNYKTISGLFEKAGFQVKLLEYFDRNKKFKYKEWDVAEGMIHRSKRFDKRNVNGELNYTSIIFDAVKISN